METMSLKDARVLKARLGKELASLAEKRAQVAVVTVIPGENPEDFIDVTADEVTEKIDACMERLIAAGRAIRRANVGMTGAASSKDIASMLERSILLRREAKLCAEMGARNPRTRERGGYGTDGAQLVQVTTYDIRKYAERAARMTQEAEALSTKIDRLDLETTVEV